MEEIFFIIIYPLLLATSLIAGRKVGVYLAPKIPEWKPLGLEGALVGFFALLISFMLVQAGNNARVRTDYIHDMADKLSFTLRKSKLYEKELQSNLYHHISTLLARQMTHIPDTKKGVYIEIRKMEGLGAHFDQQLLKHVDEKRINIVQAKELMRDLEQLESSYYRLLHSYHHSAPRLVLFILLLFSLFIGFLFGFMRGMMQTRVHISAIIFALMSYIIICVIFDLDSPTSGLIRPDVTEIENIKAVYKSYFESTVVPMED